MQHSEDERFFVGTVLRLAFARTHAYVQHHCHFSHHNNDDDEQLIDGQILLRMRIVSGPRSRRRLAGQLAELDSMSATLVALEQCCQI